MLSFSASLSRIPPSDHPGIFLIPDIFVILPDKRISTAVDQCRFLTCFLLAIFGWSIPVEAMKPMLELISIPHRLC